MKESTLVEMQKKVDSLIRVSQKLILEIQQIDSLSRGTITALQLFMGEKEWSKIVDKMKKAEEKRNKKEQEKKLDLNSGIMIGLKEKIILIGEILMSIKKTN